MYAFIHNTSAKTNIASKKFQENILAEKNWFLFNKFSNNKE